MDGMLVKVFAAALAFSQVLTETDPSTHFDPQKDHERVAALLRSGCDHMVKALTWKVFKSTT
jgi:penicillin-binding protein 1A